MTEPQVLGAAMIRPEKGGEQRSSTMRSSVPWNMIIGARLLPWRKAGSAIAPQKPTRARGRESTSLPWTLFPVKGLKPLSSTTGRLCILPKSPMPIPWLRLSGMRSLWSIKVAWIEAKAPALLPPIKTLVGSMPNHCAFLRKKRMAALMSCEPRQTARLREVVLRTSKPVRYSMLAVTKPQCARVSARAWISSLSLVPTRIVPPIKATSTKPPPWARITKGRCRSVSVGGGMKMSIFRSRGKVVSMPKEAAISLGASLE